MKTSRTFRKTLSTASERCSREVIAVKRGITVEFDYSDDGYWVMKKRGSLTIEDIAQAINERSGEDRYFFMIDTNAPEGWYDNYNLNGDYEPKGDCVKVYSFDAMKQLTGAIK